MTNTFEPASAATLRAYANRLRKGDRNLTRAAALKLAEKHENERFQAHRRNNH